MPRGAVVGVGVDLVMVERVVDAVARRPSMLERLFTESERVVIQRGASSEASARSLAGRFAAKEAVMKSLAVGLGEVDFADIEIAGGRGGAPQVVLRGRAAARADALEVVEVLLSMSHDAGMAIAMAVATGPAA
jgi:holo-[acyl-carrier protein] synthase